MNAAGWFAAFLALAAAGIAAVALLDGRTRSVAATALAWVESVVLAVGAVTVLVHGTPARIALWTIGPAHLLLDVTPLGALFVLLTAVVFAAAYPFAAAREETGSSHRAFLLEFQLLYAAVVLVPAAGDVLTFAFAWEAVSLLIYALIIFRGDDERPTRAAYLTLAMSEFGTLGGIVGLLILSSRSGHWTFAGIAASSLHLSDTARWLVFLLTFYGFGVKSGIVPVNQWLPEAYRHAPRSFAPVLSGAASNLGLYAILLVNTRLLVPADAGPGLVALLTGAVGAILGIVYAATQTNLKRALAHSSIENLSIVVAGIGAGLVFERVGHPTLAAIAFVAALYHMVNHSVYKTLLFLGSGAVETSTGTQDLDRMGGLLKRAPALGLFFLAGVLSIAAVPPFNGFASEWLTLQSLLRSVELASTPIKLCFILTGALLALAAGLALTCFIRIYASAFLGMSHGEEVREARPAPRSAVWAMGALAALCLALGIGPTYVIPALDSVVVPITGTAASNALVPPFFRVTPQEPGPLNPGFVRDFHALGAQVGRHVLGGRGLVVLHQGGTKNPVVFAMSTGYTLIVLVLLLALTYAGFRMATRKRKVTVAHPWAGGLRDLAPQMAYNATGFAAPVRVLFQNVFRPVVKLRTEVVGGHFRTAIRKEVAEEHILDRMVTRPTLTALLWIANQCRKLHRGQVNVYTAYVLVSLLLILLLGLRGF